MYMCAICTLMMSPPQVYFKNTNTDKVASALSAWFIKFFEFYLKIWPINSKVIIEYMSSGLELKTVYIISMLLNK